MLLAILIVSLLIYAWSLFSEYQSSQDSLADIEDTAKFNEQFTNYDRKDVQGYELLSLLNKIIDYNERKTEDSNNGNDTKYPYIKITINMNTEDIRKQKLAYKDNLVLFKKDIYAENELSAKNRNQATSFQKNIKETLDTARNECGGSEASLTSIAKNISSIFMTSQDIENKAKREFSTTNPTEEQINAIKEQMLQKYNSYADNELTSIVEVDNKLVISGDGSSNKTYVAACRYYEYIQFKKAIFECEEIKYDTNATGRVNEIQFKFTGNVR